MKIAVKNWEGKSVGEVEVSDLVFGVLPRPDIISRVIRWQLAKRRSGNHKAKEVGDISGTTRKPWKQKGTGRARAGSLRSPQFRGGAVIFGPVVRDHSFDIQKKVRRMALRCAVSERLASGSLTILDNVDMTSHKTKDFLKNLSSVAERSSSEDKSPTASERKSVLIVGDDTEIKGNISKAVSNIHGVDVLQCVGLNVYDIVRHEHLILSKSVIGYLEKRLLK